MLSIFLNTLIKSVKICRKERIIMHQINYSPPLLIEFLFEEFVKWIWWQIFFPFPRLLKKCLVNVVLHRVEELRLLAFVCRFACCLSCTDCRATWHVWRLMNSNHLSLVTRFRMYSSLIPLLKRESRLLTPSELLLLYTDETTRHL